MLESTKISRRQSEIRQQLAELVGKESPSEDETRSMENLDGEYRANETRFRAALIAEKPSKPGTAPNRVTGKLQEQIKVTQPEPLVARITSHAEYSRVHEFGTSTHPARPFMRPARDKTLKKVRKGAVAEVDKVVKKSG